MLWEGNRRPVGKLWQPTARWMTYSHMRADCLYTGISSGPNARQRVWEAFTFLYYIFPVCLLKWSVVIIYAEEQTHGGQ